MRGIGPPLIRAVVQVDAVRAQSLHLAGTAHLIPNADRIDDDQHAGILRRGHGRRDAFVACAGADGHQFPALLGGENHVLAAAVHRLVVGQNRVIRELAGDRANSIGAAAHD